MDGWTRHDTERFLLMFRKCVELLDEIKEELKKGDEDGSRKTGIVAPED